MMSPPKCLAVAVLLAAVFLIDEVDGQCPSVGVWGQKHVKFPGYYSGRNSPTLYDPNYKRRMGGQQDKFSQENAYGMVEAPSVIYKIQPGMEDLRMFQNEPETLVLADEGFLMVWPQCRTAGQGRSMGGDDGPSPRGGGDNPIRVRAPWLNPSYQGDPPQPAPAARVASRCG